MSEIIHQETFFNRVQSFFKINYKFIFIFIALILIIAFSTQYYFYYKNNQILKISINYNLLKSKMPSDDIKDALENLTKNKNFYAILSNLEIIKINLKGNDIISAKKNTLKLLNDSKLSSIYKTAIATNISYNFIDLVSKKNQDEIIDFINKLLSYIDETLESYQGYKIEIQYLLSLIEYEGNNNFSISLKSQELFKLIQENDKISSLIKERVKKIHEFQKYK